MKLLLDENVPVKLKHRFRESNIEAFTVRDMNWLGKENGELLQLMISNHFSPFFTVDNNLSYQQNFKTYPIQVIVLIAKDNTYSTIMESISLIIEALQSPKIGVQTIVHPAYHTR